MKKFVLTAIATTIITIAAVYVWNEIVVDYFGFWDYPDWMAYSLVCICAFVGGQAGNALSKIQIKIGLKNKAKLTYITKELL